MHSLPEVDYQVLTGLAARSKPVSVLDLAAELSLDQSQVTATCLKRSEEGLVEVTEEVYLDLRLGKKGKALKQGLLPERHIVQALIAKGEPAELPELAELSGLDKTEVGQSLRWLKQKGWAEQDGKQLKLASEAPKNGDKPGADEILVMALLDLEAASDRELAKKEVDVPAALALLEGRTGIVEEKPRKIRYAQLTAAGRKLVEEGIKPKKQVNQITPEMLRTGEWRSVELRPYDVRLEAARVSPGKAHPLVRIFEQTRRVFLEMGFSETVSSYVESGFWDFDALFQPQDHPARDMQDTFYVARPGSCHLPDAEMVERVKKTHEDGGDTGSVGWRYVWSKELAQKAVLRTHTTASTIRALAQNPTSPRKVFCVGPVFRRETVDYKQIEQFSVWINNLPPNGTAQCYISPVRATPLVKAKIRNPRLTVGEHTLMLPVEMESGSYLEFNSTEDCKVFGPDGGLLQEVKITDAVPLLAAGVNELRFWCDAADGIHPRARLTTATVGLPLTP
ncbi:phenylalanine--tRNA ligase subunit alpha [bacterium CPR1]|nr:phenylalanine--tRNA ligase subunit alpha [bacterium CPR1]